MDIDSRAEDAETLEGTGSVLSGSNVPTYRLKGLSGSASGDRSWIAAGPLGSNHSFRVQDYRFELQARQQQLLKYSDFRWSAV